MADEPCDIHIRSLRIEAHARAEMIFEAIAIDPSASFDAVQYAVSLFQTTVELGMHSTALSNAPAPILEVVDGGTSSRGTLTQRWQVGGFSHYAFRVFVNLIMVVHYRQLPLASISLRSGTASEGLIDERALLSAYPPRAEPLPFSLEILRRLEGIKYPCLRLNLALDIDDTQFACFEHALGTWGCLVMRGGYGGDLAQLELDDTAVMAETYMVARRTLEYVLHDTVPLPHAFDALLNMLARLHVTVCPLISIELE